MLGSFNVWKVVAGIAIFMLGMLFLEEALHKLTSRPFKLFLRKHTSNKIKAIAAGTLITGIVQSSSIVNLMILAFAGTGIIKMQNALAIILGANLGSTVSNWIVATVGFQLNIESFALPVTGIAGILVVLLNKETRWHTWSKLLLGFGFLFVGLAYMKTGMEEVVKHIDLGAYTRYPAILFLLIGVVMTALIQSSAATVAIVLSALYVGAIDMHTAMPIVLGAETGTSLKLLLVSVKGPAVKKKVAWGNLLFNLIPGCLLLFLLEPINHFITHTLHIHNNLIALVFFQTLVNLSGIVLFFPFLGRFSAYLDKRFADTGTGTLFIQQVNVADTELAMTALEKETRYFFSYVSIFTLTAFDKAVPAPGKELGNRDFLTKGIHEKYEYIKQLHGRMNEFCIRLANNVTDPDTTISLQQLVAVSRNTMYAAKNIKDALPDIDQLKNSSNNIKYHFYHHAGDLVAGFYEKLSPLVFNEKNSSAFETLTGIYRSVQDAYTVNLQNLYREAGTHQLSEVEFSTLINFNRETHTSLKSAIFAVKDLVLTSSEADYFDDLPGFIR